jgi:hypothetical protein
MDQTARRHGDMHRIDSMRARLAPLKRALLDHPLYREIDSLEALRVFMQHHVFAVWDFMSLLKALQRTMCCVEVPWLPTAPEPCRLINEIVLAEESDEDGQGGFASHFELYRRAMIACGADVAAIDQFLAQLRQGGTTAGALDAAKVPASVGYFVKHTFAVVDDGQLSNIAAAFTFGREDLLPAVFQRIVDELSIQASGSLELFRYYLRRHIGLDGEEHGPMAHRLIEFLCGANDDCWQAAEEAAVTALEARRVLWTGIYEALRQRKSLESTLS